MDLVNVFGIFFLKKKYFFNHYLYRPNGNRYIGEYRDHKRHGNGEFTFSNGSIFRGVFADNKFVCGTYTWYRLYYLLFILIIKIGQMVEFIMVNGKMYIVMEKEAIK